MAWIRRGVIALLALGVAVVGFAIWRINDIAAHLVEAQGSRALGVHTTVDFISIGFLPPSLRVDRLEVENPAGFSEGSFFEMGGAALALDFGSLFEDTLVARYLRLSDVEISLERKLRSTNYGVILANLKKSDSGRGSARPTPDEPADSGKKFRIGEILIRDTTAHLVLEVSGRSQRVDVELPEIRLAGVGTGGEGGAVAGQVLNAIIVGVLEALARQGSLPADLASDLLGDLRGLDRVAFEVTGDAVRKGGDLLEGAADGAAGAARGAADHAGDAAEGVGDATRKTRRGVRKLLPGRKSD